MAATITFNDRTQNIRAIGFYDASGSSYTQRGSTSNVYNCDLFPDDAVVDDAIVFAPYSTSDGKINEITINIDVGLVADSITGVWEYSSGGTNAVPVWKSLTGVTDGTNSFQTTGSNSVTFDVPSDWTNFHLTNIGSWIYYNFLIRFRITAVTNLSEGGHLANISGSSTCKPVYIYLTDFTSGDPCTMQDIYDADVAGGWGVVTKNSNQYSFNTGLWTDGDCYVSTKNEQIQFELNWAMNGTSGTGVWLIGEQYSGSKVRYGSNFLFIAWQMNYPVYSGIGANSKIYNAQFKIDKTLGGNINGYWGGDIGKFSGQEVYDVYLEGFRNLVFSYKTNAIIGVTYIGYIEGDGAIIADCTSFGATYGWRTANSTTFTPYIHRCDFSKVITAPVNPYLYNNDNNNYYAVDCDFGVFTYDKYCYWTGGGTNNKVWMTSSILLRVMDEDNNPIEGATVRLTDKDGTEIFSYTSNADGYVGRDSGVLTGATSSSISDTSKSWTVDYYRFQEIYITSGDAVGERKIVKAHAAAPYTTLPLAPDFQTTPSADDRYIVIPYVNWLKLVPIEEEVAGSVWSTATEYNPFTIKITKDGYRTYQEDITINDAIDKSIALAKGDTVIYGSTIYNSTIY